MVFSKVGEMFAESIPAGVLQMYAFVQSSNRTTAAVVSILISALTTGFGSALISYGKFLPPMGCHKIVISISPLFTPACH